MIDKEREKIKREMGKAFRDDPRFQELESSGEYVELYPPEACESYDNTNEYFLLTDLIDELVQKANAVGIPLMVIGFPKVEQDVGQSIALSIAIENPRNNSRMFSKVLALLKNGASESGDSTLPSDPDFKSLMKALKR